MAKPFCVLTQTDRNGRVLRTVKIEGPTGEVIRERGPIWDRLMKEQPDMYVFSRWGGAS